MVIVRETLMPRDKKLQRNEILKIYKERGQVMSKRKSERSGKTQGNKEIIIKPSKKLHNDQYFLYIKHLQFLCADK